MSYTDPGTVASSASASPYINDVIMTKEHKQTVRDNWQLLVENMDPTDLISHLNMSGTKVLTDPNLASVKEQRSRTLQNERLLDLLLCKPDRAFKELIRALKSTDQYHLANVLDKSGPSGQGLDECGSDSGISGTGSDHEDPGRGGASFKRPDTQTWNRSPISSNSHPESPRNVSGIAMKRKIATSTPKPVLNVRLQASQLDLEDEDAADNDSEASYLHQQDEEEDIYLNPPKRKKAVPRQPRSRPDALKKQLEQEMLEYSIIQHRNLKDLATDPTSTNFNENMNKSTNIIRLLRELEEHHRKILDLYSGSVVFCILCPTVESLEDLWHKYGSGRLKMLSQGAYMDRLAQKFCSINVEISIEINEEEYLQCLENLLQQDYPNSRETFENHLQDTPQVCKSPCFSLNHQLVEPLNDSSDWVECRRSLSRGSSSGISSIGNLSTESNSSLDPTCHFGSDNSNSPKT